MSNGKIITILKIITAVFRIFKNCRCSSTCCKSNCTVGEIETNDVEIHNTKPVHNMVPYIQGQKNIVPYIQESTV